MKPVLSHLKKFCIIAFSAAIFSHATSQVPEAFNYQAVARDATGNPLANKTVSVRFSIDQGINPGTPEYIETQTATTNQFGLFTLKIGLGNPVLGTLADVNWSSANTYLAVEFDQDGGTNYTSVGAAQLLSVPYALYAASSGSGSSAQNTWSINGNNNINDGSNFIGTTNNEDLFFKVNNQIAGVLDYKLFNTGFGYNTTAKASGANNTACGANTLYSNISGNSNTAIGANSLENNTTGNYNTAIGYSAYCAGSGFSNSTALGYNSEVDSSNEVRLGNTSVTSIGGQVGWTTYSDVRVKNTVQENVPGLAFIKALRPVTYRYDVNKEDTLLGHTRSQDVAGKYNIEKLTFSGFIAQEVDATAKQIGYDFSGVDRTGKIWGIRYADFIPSIVKGMQEQQTQLEKQQKQIDELTQQLQEMKELLGAVTVKK